MRISLMSTTAGTPITTTASGTQIALDVNLISGAVISTWVNDGSGNPIGSFAGGLKVVWVDAISGFPMTTISQGGIASFCAALFDKDGYGVTSTTRGSKRALSVELLDASGAQIVAATEATLASIKNTDGIKKITDALPAGTNLLGRAAVSHETSTIYNATTALTPKFVSVSLAASGDLLALVSSKKLRVVSGFLTVAADTTLKFQSGGSTDLTGAMTVKAGGGFVWPFNPVGYFESASGAKLNLVMGTSVQVSGALTYIEV